MIVMRWKSADVKVEKRKNNGIEFIHISDELLFVYVKKSDLDRFILGRNILLMEMRIINCVVKQAKRLIKSND